MVRRIVHLRWKQRLGPVRRYEHDHPGAMLHVDVKKLGNIPHGGGWRYLGCRQGSRNRAAMPVDPAAGRLR